MMPPLVSIGMAVYNEETHLRAALETLIAQDFRDFELIISDNASTDATRGICEEFSARDPRIRYVRLEENIGSIKNFNRVFELSKGKYFMWAGGHDLWRPAFISRCLSVLEGDPESVLCYPSIEWIDDDGKPIDVRPTRMDTRGMGVSSRLNCVIWGLNQCDLIHGLIRSAALRHSRLFQPMLSPDNLVIAELSLVGSIAFLPEPLFSMRVSRRGENYEQAASRMSSYHISKRRAVYFPSWRYLGEHLLAVFRAPVNWGRKPVLIASVLFGVFARKSKHMMHDLKNALKTALGIK